MVLSENELKKISVWFECLEMEGQTDGEDDQIYQKIKQGIDETENYKGQTEQPKLIGTLNKACIGLIGFITPQIGHKIYLFDGKYIANLQNIDSSKPIHQISYYKETLEPFIDKI